MVLLRLPHNLDQDRQDYLVHALQIRLVLLNQSRSVCKNALIKAALKTHLGDIKMVNGDHFGSVTAGLTKWVYGNGQ